MLLSSVRQDQSMLEDYVFFTPLEYYTGYLVNFEAYSDWYKQTVPDFVRAPRSVPSALFRVLFSWLPVVSL